MTTHERSEQPMREFCRALVADLALSPPLVPELLCQALSERRGRRIVLKAADLGSTTSAGHLVARRNSDLIIYEAAAPQTQQAHVIFHEIMHLVRGHVDAAAEGGGDLTCGTLLAPDFDTGTAGTDDAVIQASLYSELQEWEAETGATILSELSRARRLPTELEARAGSEQGLAGAFGLSASRWP